jgi:hypothetical protein
MAEIAELRQEFQQLAAIVSGLAHRLNPEIGNSAPRQETNAAQCEATANAIDCDTESEISENSGKMTWNSILGGSRIEPSNPHACTLASLMSDPPPLEALQSHSQTVTYAYDGVPQTAPPRNHKVDRDLCTIQQKIERAMHALVHHQETGDNNNLAIVAANLRSAWEDVHQQRRNFSAGKNKAALEPRQDVTGPRLFSPEEESKMQKQNSASTSSSSRFRGRSSFRQTRFPQERSRSRSATRNSKSFGKGSRGKGKQQSNPQK